MNIRLCVAPRGEGKVKLIATVPSRNRWALGWRAGHMTPPSPRPEGFHHVTLWDTPLKCLLIVFFRCDRFQQSIRLECFQRQLYHRFRLLLRRRTLTTVKQVPSHVYFSSLRSCFVRHHFLYSKRGNQRVVSDTPSCCFSLMGFIQFGYEHVGVTHTHTSAHTQTLTHTAHSTE